MIKILFMGEIVGIPTVKIIRKKLKAIVKKHNIDFVIANADGASDGYGVLAETAKDLLDSGIDVLTSGDLVFNKKNIKDFIIDNHNMLRPLNLSDKSPGKGFEVFHTRSGVKVGVLNLLGRTNFNKMFANDPYKAAENAVSRMKQETDVIIVDFHGGTTSEIQSMQWFLSGTVTGVLGTNLRVLTADNRVIDDYTAVITGTGVCGGFCSIGGFSPDIEIKKMITGRFFYSKIEKENINIQGAVIEVSEDDGRALSIDIISEALQENS